MFAAYPTPEARIALSISVTNNYLKQLREAHERTKLTYTTQNLISIKILFLFPGYPGDGIPKIMIHICSTTIAL